MRRDKFEIRGKILAVQPRIFFEGTADEVQHKYLGFCLLISDELSEREIKVGISDKLNTTHRPLKGLIVLLTCEKTPKDATDVVEFYNVSNFSIIGGIREKSDRPPFSTEPPDIKGFQRKGYRRLDPKLLNGGGPCKVCIWGSSQGRSNIQSETYCYGPLDCEIYRPGEERFLYSFYDHHVGGANKISLDGGNPNAFVGTRSKEELQRAKAFNRRIRSLHEIYARLITSALRDEPWFNTLLLHQPSKPNIQGQELFGKIEQTIKRCLDSFPELVKSYGGKENFRRQAMKLFVPEENKSNPTNKEERRDEAAEEE